MEVGVNRTTGRRGIRPTRERARDQCPLAPTAGLRPQLYRHEGELLRTSQMKRENKCILEISCGKQEPGEPHIPMNPAWAVPRRGLGQQQKGRRPGGAKGPHLFKGALWHPLWLQDLTLVFCSVSHGPGLPAQLGSANPG